jgi:riboflavin kinase/FMN adenylyltransferase
VIAVEPVRVDGEVVSSTVVRTCLRNGEIARAARLLDRVHDIDGVVIEGDRRGRTIGFPTANLRCDPVLAPQDGVYAIVARRIDSSQEVLRGVANLGVRPTMQAGRSVEAHLFDFEGDLYGERLRIGFVARLRGEMKFSGLDALKAQIAADATTAREALAAHDPAAWRWI